MIQIKQASESDIAVIVDILEDAVMWTDSINLPLWSKERVQWEQLSKNFNALDFYIACLDGKPAGCMAVVDHDPMFWAEIPKDESLFIHKVAVKRFAAGKGLSGALISHAKSMCIMFS